ncbi:MAG: hypothetical protein KDE53_35650 [Caldilineaceae bacterium]|nr:hypothetical protein [Caldilineaceae bacterium]
MSRNLLRWSLLLALFAVALTACAPREGGGETAAAASDSGLVIDLPAIVIDFDDAGQASIGGASAADLGLGSLSLPADQVAMLTDANIQQVQINESATGLTILVNGQAIPSLTWDADSLATANDALTAYDGDTLGAVAELLPLVNNMGAGVILNFPLAQGAAPVTAEGNEAATAAAAAQDEFLAQARSAARINLPIHYNTDGTFNVGSLPAETLATSLGLPLDSLTLTPDRIERYVGMGMETFSLATDADGIHMSLNGNDLPHISWGDGKLAYGLEVAAQAGLLGDSGDSGAMMELIQQLLPIIQTAEVTVHVTFPQ